MKTAGKSFPNDLTLDGIPATSFTATAKGTNLIYSWSFGDGATGSGATVSHTYANPDACYDIILTVYDKAGQFATKKVRTWPNSASVNSKPAISIFEA